MIRLFDAIGEGYRTVRRRWAVAGLAAAALGLAACGCPLYPRKRTFFSTGVHVCLWPKADVLWVMQL